uniref:RING-type domain-containing protein n=1 Tax=viral metagenome TaxID=1070528 RepID=A0A6C0CPK4_9ZZZZ
MICTICYNNKIRNKCKPNGCQHEFCYGCLKQWYDIDSEKGEYYARCPVCRQNFNDIIKITKNINNFEPRVTRSQTMKTRSLNIKTRCSYIINKISEICSENDQEQINNVVYDKLIPELLNLFYNNKWFLVNINNNSDLDEPFTKILFKKLDDFEKLGFLEGKIWKWKFRELLK